MKRFLVKFFVSKNVCHGVVWDRAMHNRMRPYRDNYAGLDLVFSGMETYLIVRPSGKAFHDPLAACVAIDSSICEFRNVDIYRESGKWGSKINRDSNNKITISVNRPEFERVLSGL